MGKRIMTAIVFLGVSIPAFAQNDDAFNECRAKLMKDLGDSMANRPLLLGDGQGGLRGVILPNGQVRSMAGGGNSDAVAAEIQQALAEAGTMNTVVSAVVVGPTIIDDFNRPDSAVLGTATIGGVWVDSEPFGFFPPSSVALVGGRAVLVNGVFDFPGPTSALAVGNLATFDIQATFNNSAADARFHVNATSPLVGIAGDGLSMRYLDGATTFSLAGPSIPAGSASPAFASLATGTDMTFRLVYNGATLTGTITQGAITQSHSIVTTNGPGTNIIIHAADTLPGGTIQVDNITGP